jgi:signal transduction histidine kinase
MIDKFSANTEHQIELVAGPAISIQADEKLLQRALSNLLSNALRYCHTKVWIELSLEDTDCLIDICDDGAGWHSNQQPSPNPSPDSLSHHGIGLAIVTRVANQHGGEFLRMSRAGGGAVARLKLPVGSAPAADV